MESLELSGLLEGGQVAPLVEGLAKLVGLPVRLTGCDGRMVASAPGPSGRGGAQGVPGGKEGRLLEFPVEVDGACCAVLAVGPYRPSGRRTCLSGKGPDGLPALSRLRVEVVKARAQVLVQVLADRGERTLELRRTKEEQSRTEAALTTREAQYRSLVEQMNEGILAGDRSTRITFVNSRMAAMLGYQEKELLGRPFYDFMEPGTRLNYLARIERRHVGVSEKYETILVRKGGQKICALISASPLRDDRNDVVGSFAVISDITERKRAEQTLRESEEKFRHLFETMQDVFYQADPEGRLTLLSPSGARLLEYAQVEELLGRKIDEAMYLNPEDRRKFMAAIRERGFVKDYEVTLRKRDGTPVVVSTNSLPTFDDYGKFTGVEGTFFDITDRKRAEEALRQSEERYRLIMDNVQDIIFTHLPDGTVSFISSSIRHLGYAPEETLGRDIFEFVHPEDRELAKHAFERTLETCRGMDIEIRIRCKSGEYRWAAEHSDPVLRDGRAVEVTCVLRDITTRKLAEEKLRLSNEKYELIINNTRDLIYSYGPDGIVSFISESIRRVGYEIQEVVGHSLFDFMHPEDRQASRDMLAQAVEGTAFKALECRLRRKDGVYVWFEASSEAILAGGRIVQVNGVARDITERKSIEEALRVSEEKYRRIIDHLQDIIYTIQPDGRVSFISESVKRLGYEPGDLMDQPIAAFMHPEDLPGARLAFEQALKHDVREQIECRLKTKDGAYVWFGINHELILQDGALVQVNAIARNIARGKAAEMALRDSEEKYRWLLEQLSEGVLVCDLDGVITFVNPRMADMLGYGADELLGRKDLVFMGEEDSVLYRACAERRANGIGEQHEIQLVRKDGSHAHFMVSGTPLTNRDGEIVGSFGVLSDITEWKRAQEELKRLSAAIEQTSDSIIIADTQGVILYANPASQTLSGLPLSSLVGNTLDLLRSDKHTGPFYQKLWSTVRAGETWSGRLANVRADGTRYDTTTTMSPVRDGGGHVQYVVTCSRDITREVELEVQLRHSQRMEAIGVMAGGIAHDFNNLLTPVVGYAEMALNRPGLDAKIREYLKEISSAGQRAGELVQQILTFSRQTEQVKQPVLVEAIVKESLKLLRAAIPPTITIRQRISGRGTQTLADPSQVHQVVMNLCTNAFHAMRETGGILEIVLEAVFLESPLVQLGTTLPPGDYLRLRVSDTGGGMDEETQKKIFLPFFTTKRTGEGTGLGLSIVHGIVLGMGGSISVESDVGKGTAFTIHLPSVDRDVKEVQAVRQEPPRGSERIMVVDDESVIGDMLQDALSVSGYAVEAFESSVRALERVRRDPDRFDLVITDLVMPEMAGMDLARRIWAVRPGLPIILLTGYTEDLDEDSAQTMGFAKLLRKPVPLAVIAQAVRAVLDRAWRDQGMSD